MTPEEYAKKHLKKPEISIYVVQLLGEGHYFLGLDRCMRVKIDG